MRNALRNVVCLPALAIPTLLAVDLMMRHVKMNVNCVHANRKKDLSADTTTIDLLWAFMVEKLFKKQC